MGRPRSSPVVEGPAAQAQQILHYRFDIKAWGLHGVALFVPAGLTAFQIKAADFAKAHGSLMATCGPVLSYRVAPGACAPLIQIAQIHEHGQNYHREEVDGLIAKVFSLFEASGCRTVGMNGLRLEDDWRGEGSYCSEQVSLDAVRRWTRAHPDSSIRDIYLIDLRGGFEHVR